MARAARQNPLERYFVTNTGRQIDKWMHYFDIYDRHFDAFRGAQPTVVEFGVQHGGSLQMWKWYFGRGATIVGVDIDPRCLLVADPGTRVVIGDQEDRHFLSELAASVGPIDVLIDDGGHTMRQQIATFEEMWPAIADGGVYLAEDLHTSYWERFGGGFGREGTFVEYVKGIIDQQNARHSDDSVLVETPLTRTVGGIHSYDSVIVFDKRAVGDLDRRVIGSPSW